MDECVNLSRRSSEEIESSQAGVLVVALSAMFKSLDGGNFELPVWLAGLDSSPVGEGDLGSII